MYNVYDKTHTVFNLFVCLFTMLCLLLFVKCILHQSTGTCLYSCALEDVVSVCKSMIFSIGTM